MAHEVITERNRTATERPCTFPLNNLGFHLLSLYKAMTPRREFSRASGCAARCDRGYRANFDRLSRNLASFKLPKRDA